MERIKDTGNEIFNKSSMSVIELNNYIVALRPTVKKAKTQAIRRLMKQIKQYRSRKGTDEQVAANLRKADRLVAEITLLKKVKKDKVAKFSLGNTLTVNQAVSRANAEEKALTRIACSNLMQKVITRWRQEHEDWEALAAFALSKNTGRRFKNKPRTDSNSAIDANVDREMAVSQTSVSEETAVHFSDSIQDDDETVSGSGSLNNKSSQLSSVKPSADKRSKVKREPNASHCQQQATQCRHMQQPTDGSCRSVTQHDVVVKQVSLDELSDEELLLPPPDDDVSESVDAAVQSAGRKIANSFFVVSSDGESSDDEAPVSEALIKTAASLSDSDDGIVDSAGTAGLWSSVKSSTMFAESLSHHQPSRAVRTAADDKRRKRKDSFQQNQRFKPNAKKHFDNRNAGKRFSDKQFTKSRDNRYLKKNEKSSYGNAKVNTNGKGQQNRRNGWSATSTSKADAKTIHQKKPVSLEHEKLHPSWEASRQRKEREKNVFVFHGTRKTFSDDD